MRYENIVEAKFISRPNRFIAHVLLDGKEEVVHVKNTGRCKELLRPGAAVYLQDGKNPKRKTRYDLIAVRKGERLVNMDSQVPNGAVREWIETGHLFHHVEKIKPEYTYGNSRVDLYVEADGKKCLIEVKGVTLEENNAVSFPDAPSERAIKHIHELTGAVEAGYEAYIFFVIQMKDVRYFTPNVKTHEAFAKALVEASKKGVHVIARDCLVTEDSIEIRDAVEVRLEYPQLFDIADPLLKWYEENKRDLPWRRTRDPYYIWVSEIMLQQTRVEAVKPYYERFLQSLPTLKDLAEVEEDKLLKLWEGLGYYNRVRNMQKAACVCMEKYNGRFPETYEEILGLPGIGNYTAGAISSIAYGISRPAADGNVYRVLSRLLGSDADILKQSTRKWMEELLLGIVPVHDPASFNQGLIELGALICLPGGVPKCDSCPLEKLCMARSLGIERKLPIRSKGKERRIEKRTVLILRDSGQIAIKKRPDKGLLAGMYELPNLEGHKDKKALVSYLKGIGLMPIRIKKLEPAKHIFSHVEWHMIGYDILVDELEKTNEEDFLFIHPKQIKKEYPIPTAFEKYMP